MTDEVKAVVFENDGSSPVVLLVRMPEDQRRAIPGLRTFRTPGGQVYDELVIIPRLYEVGEVLAARVSSLSVVGGVLKRVYYTTVGDEHFAWCAYQPNDPVPTENDLVKLRIAHIQYFWRGDNRIQLIPYFDVLTNGQWRHCDRPDGYVEPEHPKSGKRIAPTRMVYRLMGMIFLILGGWVLANGYYHGFNPFDFGLGVVMVVTAILVGILELVIKLQSRGG